MTTKPGCLRHSSRSPFWLASRGARTAARSSLQSSSAALAGHIIAITKVVVVSCAGAHTGAVVELSVPGAPKLGDVCTFGTKAEVERIGL